MLKVAIDLIFGVVAVIVLVVVVDDDVVAEVKSS